MVSKCIGAMKGVRLFSEIHPEANHYEYLNVTDQAARWYGMGEKEDVVGTISFIDGVKRTRELCEQQGDSMVLRDWASVDFIGRVLVTNPVYRFRLDEVLAAEFNLRICSLVRHPLDQWLSSRRLKVYADKLDAREFFLGFRRYVEAIGPDFVRYEDFTKDPERQMPRICGMLGVGYDPGFRVRWHENENITGDNKNSSRGSQKDNAHLIQTLPRRAVDPALQAEIEANADYQWIVERLGYQTASPASV